MREAGAAGGGPATGTGTSYAGPVATRVVVVGGRTVTLVRPADPDRMLDAPEVLDWDQSRRLHALLGLPLARRILLAEAVAPRVGPGGGGAGDRLRARPRRARGGTRARVTLLRLRRRRSASSPARGRTASTLAVRDPTARLARAAPTACHSRGPAAPTCCTSGGWCRWSSACWAGARARGRRPDGRPVPRATAEGFAASVAAAGMAARPRRSRPTARSWGRSGGRWRRVREPVVVWCPAGTARSPAARCA